MCMLLQLLLDTHIHREALSVVCKRIIVMHTTCVSARAQARAHTHTPECASEVLPKRG